MRKIPQPSGAVADMLEQDGELDRILSGQGLLFDNPPAPHVEPPPPLVIPPADWVEPEPEEDQR